MTERKSLEPSVFQVNKDAEKDVLTGSKCRQCHRVFFPKRVWCAACLEPTCDEIELSREGTLLSFSLVEKKQAYCLLEAPYVLGEVLLPEGPHIYTSIGAESEVTPEEVKPYSTIGEDNLDTLKIGQKVSLKPVVIKKDEEGNDIVAYNFNVVK